MAGIKVAALLMAGMSKGCAGWRMDNSITVMDYFVAHAPADPWPMFQPIMPQQPPSLWMDEKKLRSFET
ncbi:hypothetical protein IAI21_11045, partial [Streptococcus pseudopneumoniae]|uniref:hypothetical protein n=1 Tax=Streptococcus pseudopneumoniae TaxID=257758 RepID=UPI0018B09DE4